MSTTSAKEGGGRAQQRRLRNRNRMLDVAAEMFASRTYAAVRIEAIADAADVSVGTVYTHFESKDGLFLAVIERAVEQATQLLAEAVRSTDSPIGRAAAIGAAYLQLLTDQPAIAGLLSATADSLGDGHQAVRGEVVGQIQVFYDILAAEIRTAVEVQEIRPVEPRLLASFLVAAWTGMVALEHNSHTPTLGQQDLRAALDQATDILLAGLRPTS